MSVSPNIEPAEVNEEWVLTKCDHFTNVQLWPAHTRIDPNGWLSNFLDSEKEHAVHLLNSVLYFSDPIIDQLFVAAFKSLSLLVGCPGMGFRAAQARWHDFINSMIITHATGEIPSTTDSGYLFARRARDFLGLPENRIVDNREALIRLAQSNVSAVVFVDDFVGTGNQFRDTWTRRHDLGFADLSFEDVAAPATTQYFYCPLFCTTFALERTLSHIKNHVHIVPSHIISPSYSVFDPHSFVWPPRLRPTATTFLHAASARAGLPDTNGHDTMDWQGFSRLGLTIAFSHKVPDATIPILYTDRNNWKRLFRKP